MTGGNEITFSVQSFNEGGLHGIIEVNGRAVLSGGVVVDWVSVVAVWVFGVVVVAVVSEPFVVEVSVDVSLVVAETWVNGVLGSVALVTSLAVGAWFSNLEDWVSLLVSSDLELANNDLLEFLVSVENFGVGVTASDVSSFGPDELGQDSLLAMLSSIRVNVNVVKV